MEVPWSVERCIICLVTGPVTKEHLIPQQIGGKLWARFLCKDCNDRLGDEIEPKVKSDPAIQAAARALARQIPDVAKRILDGAPHIAHGPAGISRGRFKGGTFSVDTVRRVDGAEISFIQPTPEARKHIATVIGEHSPGDVEAALKRFDEAPQDQRIDLAPDLTAMKQTIDRVEPTYEGPLFSEIALLKIAYEFLACHLGELIYDGSPAIADIRGILSGAVPPREDVFTVEHLTTREYEPVHGLALVSGGPPAVVKIYLFGWLVFRVTLHRIGVGPPRGAYMCRLDTGDEDFVTIEPGDVSSGGDSEVM